MTISTTSNKTVAQGNGITNSFGFSFEIPLASQLLVYYTDASGNITLLSPSQYSVTGIGSTNGGAVTYPLSGSPIASGTSLTIARVVPYYQLTDLVNQSGYYPNVVESALDYLTMEVQQLAEEQSRTIQFPIVDASTNNTLPAAAACANKTIVFGSDGSVGVSADDYVNQTAITAASAAASASSASASAVSATASAGSATTATTEAGIATSAATTATTEAGIATSAATTATTEAGIATAAAATATTEAGIATSAATTATTEAGIATAAAATATTEAGIATSAASAAAASVAAAQVYAAALTSTTSLTVGTGSQTLTVAAGVPIPIGVWMLIADSVAPSNYMHGQVTAYNSITGALTVNATDTGGAGTFSTWSVTVSGTRGTQGPAGATFTESTISSNQTLHVANTGFNYVATAALALTIDQTTTLATTWTNTVLALGGNVTITPNAADKINGGAAGAGLVIPKGYYGAIITDANGNLYVEMGWAESAPITLASASTVDLGTAGTPNVTISGTTTITSFGSSAQAGQIFNLTFSGSCSLTENAISMILPGGANIYPVNGDCMLVQALGSSNFRVIAFQPASGAYDRPGKIIDYAGTTAPAGYLVCPTSQTNISRATYAALFLAIGTTWGAGDGSTTFGMPWFAADNASVQANSNVGTATSGAVISHNHTATQGTHTHTTNAQYIGSYGDIQGGADTSGYLVTGAYVSTVSAGAITIALTGGTANLAAGVRVLKCVKY